MPKEIVFDLETTGLEPYDRITQYTFLNIETNEFIASYVKPEIPIHPKAVAVTGITDLDLKDKQTFHHHISKILDFIIDTNDTEPTYLIAHNGDTFDRQILAQEFQRCGSRFPIFQHFRFIDTVKLSRKLLHNELESHKLDSLRNYCNLSSDNAHSAAKDVFDLAIVYNEFKKNNTVEELYEISFHFFPFGKHRGKDFREIPEEYIKNFILKKEIYNTDPTVLSLCLRYYPECLV